jgi:small subunit ribosomal protein S16
MVRIRLLRVGAIRQPSYRIVVSDQRSPRDGRFIEIIGNYNPRTEPNTVVVNRERALFWLKRGAQPSEPVARLLEQTSVMAIHRGETTLEEVSSRESA